jgi:hypothetical protein
MDQGSDILKGGVDLTNPLVQEMSSIYIAHPRFIDKLEGVRRVIDTLHRVDEEPFCLQIGGPSGVGKSTLIRKLKEIYPRRPNAVALEHPLFGKLVLDNVPVVFAKMPTQPTVISLGQAMLKALGDPNYWRGGRSSVETRVDMGASVVARSDTSPILELGEHVLDFMALLVERLVIIDGLLAVFPARNTRNDITDGQRIAEPVAVIASVSDERRGIWQTGQ